MVKKLYAVNFCRLMLIATALVFLIHCSGEKFADDNDGEDMVFEFNNLAWMEGSWIGEHDGGVMFVTWVNSGSRELIGESCIVKDEDTVFAEKLQIENYGKNIRYAVKLKENENEVFFTLIDIDKHYAVFENPENDFPTRITYKHRADGSMHAHIEGIQNGKETATDFYLSSTEE